MPSKKTKNKPAEKKPDKKDEKKEPTPPPPAPAPAEPVEPEQEPAPIPVPEPIPLPVPAPIGKHHNDDTNSSRHERADHINIQDGPTDEQGHGGWEQGRGGGWSAANSGGWEEGSASGGDGWANSNGWGDGEGGYESNGEDAETVYDDSGWEHATHGQEQYSSVEQHTQDQAPLPVPPPPAPPQPQPAPTQPTPLQHDWSSASAQQATVAPPPPQPTNPPPVVPKTYISASAMANRNRNRPPSPSAHPPPAQNKPSSFFWAPNQPPPPKQPISTTKGQHNPVLTKLSAWGEPKNVDPWGDPKQQPNPAPAPPQPPPPSGQARPAWQQWGRQPQQPQPPAPATPPPAVKQQPARVDYSRSYGNAAKQQPARMDYRHDYEYYDNDDDDDDDGTYDEWGGPSQGQHGWGPDPRKQAKVNHVPPSSEDGLGVTSKPVLSSTEYSQIANAMLNDVPQSHSGHRPQHHAHYPNSELSHHQQERAWRLQQLAEEQHRMAQIHEQQTNQKGGKGSKKPKENNTEWEGSEWGANTNGWGRGGWGHQSGGGGGDGGGTWGQSDDGRGQSRSGWDSGDGWGHQEDTGWRNDNGTDTGWGNGGDGGSAWGNDGGWGQRSGSHGWGNDSDNRGKGASGKQKQKRQDTGWDDQNQDNSWGNAKDATNDWGANDTWEHGGGWGDEQEPWDDEEDDGWDERYHVVTNAAPHKTSQTLMHAMDGSKSKAPKPSKPTISSRLDLPEGTVNESGNQAFKDSMRAIFGKERMARDRIHWTYSPENEVEVSSVIEWIMKMEGYLAAFGLLKFLETKERGALFVNAKFRLDQYPNVPAFDWLRYDQVQGSADRILQHSILACDPANQTLVFIYLASWTGNSVAMWRRKLQVPKGTRQACLPIITQVKAGLHPDEYRIHVDELPPTDKKKGTKLTKSVTKQATKIVPSKAALAKADKDAKSKKPAKSALKAHQRGQSLSTIPENPEKKRKWWQFLRFA